MTSSRPTADIADTLATRNLTLAQASARLGKSERQLRYMVQKGELAAFKSGKRWLIRLEDLPPSPAPPGVPTAPPPPPQAPLPTARGERDAQSLAAAAEQPARRRYSITDLRAFQHARPIHADLVQRLGAEHPTTRRLRAVLDHLARGCHAYAPEQKAKQYEHARDEAASAVVDLLLLEAHPEAAHLAAQAEALEQVVLPIIGGLQRTTDRGRRRSRFQAFGGPAFPGEAA